MGLSKYSLLILLGIFLALFFGTVGMIASTNDKALSFEEGIKASNKNSQIVLSTHYKTIKEMVQIPDMYTEDLQKVFKSAIESRYGDDGSKALVQFIKEHNPNFDSSLYTKIQTAIESGRKDFRDAQQKNIDMCRSYKTYQNKFINKIILGFTDYPKDDLSKECMVIQDKDSARAFETGIEEDIKFK